MKSYFWSVVHNAIAHPLMVTRTEWSYRFHDWTADRMGGDIAAEITKECAGVTPPSYRVYEHPDEVWNWETTDHGCCMFESQKAAVNDAWDDFFGTHRRELLTKEVNE